MTKLALAKAPPPRLPLRWLLTSPVWGIVAGVWLIVYGDASLASRWSLHAVALVHIFVLGVLGNAMLGSLLQFLPVAAETPVPIGPRASACLHGLFNVGLFVFLPALIQRQTLLLTGASVLLSLPLLAFAGVVVPALLRRGTGQTLRAGITFSLSALLLTAVLGVMLVSVLRGDIALPLDRLADAHAVLGLLGWVIVLMATVSSATMPMFQGTARLAPGKLFGWLWLAGLGLVLGIVWRLEGRPRASLAFAVAPAMFLFVAVSLWLPWRAPLRKPVPLVWFWRIGLLSLATAATLAMLVAVGQIDNRYTMLAGALGIGVGLPMMLSGMMLEINGFLAWIHLRTACPRGIRVPGVKLLAIDRDKWIAFAAQSCAVVTLPLAATRPSLVPLAGIAVLLAHGTTLVCLIVCQQRARRFLRQQSAQPEGHF